MTPDYQILHDLQPRAGDALLHPFVIAALAAIIGIAIGTAAIISMIQRDRARHGPAFRTFARELNLQPRQRRLLAQLAHFAGARFPGALLISRGCFDHAAARYVQRFGRDPRIDAIRRRVFE